MIDELRARARRRRLLTAGTVLLLAVQLAAGSGAGVARGSAPSRGRVAPDQPVALAVLRGGGLAVGDRGRNEILRWSPSHGFRVVAGTGVAGSTGDGGPAARAELRDPGSLVVARDGTIYFTQAGRYRAPVSSSGGMLNTEIREVTPTGTIRTIAGLHPRCPARPPRSIGAESALLYGASLSLSPSGALAVDARVCAGRLQGGLGPNLRLTQSGRFVEDASNPVPAVASVDCGSGVRGRRFRAFACMSGGGHPHELLVVRSDGSSVAYPAYRGGAFAVGAGEVVAAEDAGLVRVTSRRLVPLLTSGELAGALHVGSTAITDVYAPAVDARGDVYFVASLSSRSGCQNRILERTPGGAIDQIWASSTSRHNTCG
jgi:hypothetical protein